MTPLSFDYPIRVAILYFGGSSKDLEDTLNTVKEIKNALEKRGHGVVTCKVNKQNWRQAVHTPGEVVINLVEDPKWELYEKVGRKLCEMGRAQLGHDAKSFDYATRKLPIKQRLSELGVSTPKYRIIKSRRERRGLRGLEYPLIVKPGGQHAGIGISQDSVVIDEGELLARVDYLQERYGREVIVEEYIDGREVHAYAMGNGRHVFCLPIYEVAFSGGFMDNWDIYTYSAKWDNTSWEYWDCDEQFPVKLGSEAEKRLEKMVMAAFAGVHCCDIARMDIRYDEKRGKFYVIDININPSLNRYGATEKVLGAIDWTYEDFLETLLAITYKRIYGQMPSAKRTAEFLQVGYKVEK